MEFIDSFNNKSIAKLLRHVAAAYIAIGDNHFQIIAYERAADSIDNLNIEIKDLWKKNRLSEIYGIGPNIQSYLEELFKTGQVRHFEALFKKLPSAMFPLLDISGIGPKTAFKLAKELKLKKGSQNSVYNQLERAARTNRIAKLEGFGEKSQQEILESVKQRKKDIGKNERMLLPYATALAFDIIDYLKKSPAVISITPLGSLRRMKATVGDVDIAVSSRQPEVIIERFVNYPKAKILEKGRQKARIILSGQKQIDLMIQPPGSFGSLIQHQTGSKAHNIHLREVALKMNLSVSEHGIKFARGKKRILKQFAKEENLYKTLKMAFIPPELREDNGEIEAAQQNKLPKLVEFKDIKGDIHLHSNFEYSSSHDAGIDSMEELVEKALQLGYQYIGFADHNPSISNQTERQIAEIINKRTQKIEEIKSTYISRNIICIFNLFEVDILANGKLALSSRLIKKLDAVIASVHSSFNQDKMRMTKRILKALKNPKVKVLGHPTGRLLGAREGYQLNWDEVFNFCRLKKIALEVNAFPQRLDLPDSLIHQAVNNGVKLIINTDAHEINQMDLMRFGVATARRGWATKSDIINTYPARKFAKWLKEN